MRLKQFFQKYIWVILIISIYVTTVSSGIEWGIPNAHHPFAYHMDEWAQSQSIRALFKHGTPNISGASHGAIFHYFISGIYLIPFILLHIVNPFTIKSPFTFIDVQHRLFELLRINTLLFGVVTIVMIVLIVKKYWKINPFLTCMFFTITPLWFTLSNYFKYDIALSFWITVAIYWILKYGENTSRKNFIIAGFFSGLTLATKVSAFPMGALYIVSFFIGKTSSGRKFSDFFFGIVTYICTFLVLGIPDFLISSKEYLDWWQTNTNSVPSTTSNIIFHMPYQQYLFWNLFASEFGHAFYMLFLTATIFTLCVLIKNRNKVSLYNKERILFLGVCLFGISILPLKMYAYGNRALVFLPFFAILTGVWTSRLQHAIVNKKFRIVFYTVLILFTSYQMLETASWVSVRLYPDPRETSSLWVQKHIPQHSRIGLENVPIFQMEPDIFLKEFYMHQYTLHVKTQYNYIAINAQTKDLPPYVVVTNDRFELTFYKKSPKNDLVHLLQKKNYRQIARFYPDYRYFHYFNSWNILAFPVYLIPDTITIYKNRKSNRTI